MPKRERETTSSRSDSHVFSRRDFVARTSLIGAGLVVGPLLWTGCSDQSADVRSTTATGSARGSNKMKTRQLGTLQVSEIGAGAMSISANYGPPADRDEGIKVLREAHQRGVTFFDTAEVYTRARRSSAKRSRLFATACGSRRSSASTSKEALVV